MVAAIAAKIGRPPMPWQREAYDVAYEYDPVTGLYRYTEVDITVPRQSGKTILTLGKKVYRCTVAARTLGPQRVTYTAQKRLNARRKLERDFAELLRSSRSFREVAHAKARPTKATEWRLSLNNGSEAIQFGTGSFLQIDTPSRTGAHGDTLDDGTIDEAFAHEDDTIEAGMRPAMATRRNAQIWVISTAGDARSKYLYRKVLAGRAAAEAGEHGNVCYIEYSAPEDADPGAPATWWGCMPALGHTIDEAFIRGEWERAQRKGQEGIDMFLRAYLNLWPEVPDLGEDGAQWQVIAESAWSALVDGESRIDGPRMFAVDVSPDRSVATVAVAGARSDGVPHVEAIRSGAGTAWVVDYVRQRVEKWSAPGVVIDERGPAGSLVAPLRAEGVEVVSPSGREAVAACGRFYDAVAAGVLRHRGQPILSAALAGAVKRTAGDAWVWDRRKPSADITPLVAATFALWGFDRREPAGGPNVW